MNPTQGREKGLRRWVGDHRSLCIFVALFLPLVFLRIAILADQRIPLGHDAFQYLHLQYVFFNEATRTGLPPLWMPFMTHGTTSNIWLIVSQGLLSSVWYPLSPVLKNVNFLYLHQAGILVDEAVLLMGCVLLGQKLYRTAGAVVFTSAAVTYTAISSTQVWFDFHAFYLLPMLCHCALRALEGSGIGHSLSFFLLLGASSLGNLPYFLPLTAFVVVVFSATYVLWNPGDVLTSCRRWRLRRRHGFFFIPAVLFLNIVVMLSLSRNDLTFNYVGRDSSGNVQSVYSALTYGLFSDFGKYWEWVTRLGNHLDMTIYGGLLMVPFAVASVALVRQRLAACWAITGVILVLLSASTLVSAAFYYLFPGGQLFRHMGLVAPTAKMCVLFCAGFGFDRMWEGMQESGTVRTNQVLKIVLGTLMLAVTAIVLFCLGFPTGNVLPWYVPTQTQPWIESANFGKGLLGQLSLGIFMAAVVFLAADSPASSRRTVLVLLGLHCLDVFALKVEKEYIRIPHASDASVQLFRTDPVEFVPIRKSEYESAQRSRSLMPYGFGLDGKRASEEGVPIFGPFGSAYWSLDSFLGIDPPVTPFRVDHLLKGVAEFNQQVMERDSNEAERRWLGVRRVGPGHGAADPLSKLSGSGWPKLQLFSGIRAMVSQGGVETVLKDSRFRGDSILASQDDLARAALPESLKWAAEGALTANDRIEDASIEVTDFRFDQIRLRVVNPTQAPAILYYADGYHPLWSATVNRKDTRVIRTNLGYKSVAVPAGHADVKLTFGRPFPVIAVWGMICLGIAALAIVGCYFIRELAMVKGDTSFAGVQSEPAFAEVKGASWLKYGLVIFLAAGGFMLMFALNPSRGMLWQLVSGLTRWTPSDDGVVAVHVLWLVILVGACMGLGWLVRRSSYWQFVRLMAVIGIVLDIAGVVVFGRFADWSFEVFGMHLGLLAVVGYLSGPAHRRLAWLAGLAMLVAAWSLPLPELLSERAWFEWTVVGGTPR